jgi:hypothetical protein
MAQSVNVVLGARVAERFGKGLRDARRDALLADITVLSPSGADFGLRLASARRAL